MTPEEAAKAKAEKEERERKEQLRLKEISESWQNDKDLTPEEREEITIALNRISPGIMVSGVVQPCPKKQKGLFQYCVPPTKKASFTRALKESVKQKAGGIGENCKEIKVNYDKIDQWEQTHSNAYVPWGPKINKVKKDIGEPGKPHIVSVLVPSTKREKQDGEDRLEGQPHNSSGVTIGTGIDLGAQNKEKHAEALTKAAKESGLLSEEDTKKLIEKLKPYYGLKQTKACQALRKMPLNLSQAETDLLNHVSLTRYTKDAVKNYELQTGKKWNDLSEEEQTTLLSYHYHHGSFKKPFSTAVSNSDKDTVLKKLKGEREHDYMEDYYKKKAEAEKPISQRL